MGKIARIFKRSWYVSRIILLILNQFFLRKKNKSNLSCFCFVDGPVELSCLHCLSVVHHSGIGSKWLCCEILWKENIVLLHQNGPIFLVSDFGHNLNSALAISLLKFIYNIFASLHFAEDPKDLIRKCLVVEPEKRITVKEALAHPFFTTTVRYIFNSNSVRFFLLDFLLTLHLLCNYFLFQKRWNEFPR